MNILRLSLFKLKKNKKEAVAIIFLTMITTLMLSVFAANEKTNSLQFINMFMYFLAFFSGITLLSAVLMIMNRITNDIEDQMQQIGVLEVLGYRSHEISLSYVYEYMVTTGIGAV